MIDLKRLKDIGREIGFTLVAPVDAETMQSNEKVREMCASGKCHKYAKAWSCPPACGTIEDCSRKIHRYHSGIIVQTTAYLEDELDGETMMETESCHKENFLRMNDVLRLEYPDMLSLGAGCCTRCKVCTYPDAACRFPEKMFSSLEAYGILVTDLCRDNHIKYYYGKNTITYSSCFLLE